MLTSNLSNSRKDMELYWISAPVSNPSDGLISLTRNYKLLFMVQHEPMLIFRKLLFTLCIFYTIWKPNPNHNRNWALLWFKCLVIKISVIKLTMCWNSCSLEMLPKSYGYQWTSSSDDLQKEKALCVFQWGPPRVRSKLPLWAGKNLSSPKFIPVGLQGSTESLQKIRRYKL